MFSFLFGGDEKKKAAEPKAESDAPKGTVAPPPGLGDDDDAKPKTSVAPPPGLGSPSPVKSKEPEVDADAPPASAEDKATESAEAAAAAPVTKPKKESKPLSEQDKRRRQKAGIERRIGKLKMLIENSKKHLAYVEKARNDKHQHMVRVQAKVKRAEEYKRVSGEGADKEILDKAFAKLRDDVKEELRTAGMDKDIQKLKSAIGKASSMEFD